MASKSLMKKVSSENNLTQQESITAIDRVVRGIIGALKDGETVRLAKLGTFSPVYVPPKRMVTNLTGEALNVAAKIKLEFRPSPSLQEELTKVLLSKLDPGV